MLLLLLPDLHRLEQKLLQDYVLDRPLVGPRQVYLEMNMCSSLLHM